MTKTNQTLIDYLETTEFYEKSEINQKLVEHKLYLSEIQKLSTTLTNTVTAYFLYSLILTIYVFKTTFYPKSPKK